MKCSEIIKILETLSPRSMACDWDNPGLLAGRSGKEVKTIFLAVDATDSVIEQAEIERVKKVRVVECPNCSATIAKHSLYCPQCGKSTKPRSASND